MLRGEQLCYGLRQHRIHGDVVGFAGDSVQKLKGKTNAQPEGMRQTRQQAVVITTTSPEPMPVMVEGHAWDERKFYIAVQRTGEGLPRGFKYVKSPLAQAFTTLIVFQEQIVPNDHGQKQLFSRTKSLVEEQLKTGFIGQGMVKKNRMSRLP